LGAAQEPASACRGEEHAPCRQALDELSRRVGFRSFPGSASA
jgi:hypothetical protein